MVVSSSRPDFFELETLLADCDCESEAAEVHGSLCSLLSIYGDHARDVWMTQALAGCDQAAVGLSDCREYLQKTFGFTTEKLGQGELDFELLLPDDESPIADRAEGIASWASGFLHGVGVASNVPGLRDIVEREPLSEILADILAISQAGDDGLGSENESEQAIVELIEYLRVALQLCFEEFAPVRAAIPTPTEHLH